MNTILNQPNRRRVSTDRLNRVDSQLVASLDAEFTALNPTERPSHTLIPQKQVSEGRGQHENSSCNIRANRLWFKMLPFQLLKK